VTGVTGPRGSAATAAAGSSGPRSVSHTTIPSRVPAQAASTLAPHTIQAEQARRPLFMLS
jgi:hypothetical protein